MKTRTLFFTALILGATGCTVIAPESRTSRDTPVQSPDRVVASMNRLYNDSNNKCLEAGTQEPRGHYYCSGITIRVVSSGDYPPWSHSPNVIETGSSSYSWIRHDYQTERLLYPAGFILRNPLEGATEGLQALENGFMCLYPFDAITGTNSVHKGCGLKKTNIIQAIYPQPTTNSNNAAHAWGSCEAMGVTTRTAWEEFFLKHSDLIHGERTLCSWNIESQSGWNNAIASHANFYSQLPVTNELLLEIKDDGTMLKKYIAAFFYDPANKPGEGLENARTFQTKLNAGGYTVPILRIDFTAPQHKDSHM